MIPFLEHDDANRALMGANMQRQAVPLIRSEAPVVGTGMELRAAVDAGDVIVTEKPGVVEEVSADFITVMADDGTRRTYRLRKSTVRTRHLLQPASDHRRGSACRGRPGSGRRPLHRER